MSVIFCANRINITTVSKEGVGAFVGDCFFIRKGLNKSVVHSTILLTLLTPLLTHFFENLIVYSCDEPLGNWSFCQSFSNPVCHSFIKIYTNLKNVSFITTLRLAVFHSILIYNSNFIVREQRNSDF